MRELAFLLLRATGIPLLLRRFRQRNAVTILCYHDPHPDLLRHHLRALQEFYEFVSLRSYVDWRLGRGPAPPPYAMVITLDDGHRGNVRLANIFSKHAIPATIFLCSAIVGTHRHYWWTAVGDDAVREWLKSIPDVKRIEHLRAMGFEETLEFKDRQGLNVQELQALRPLVDFQSHTRFHPVLPQCSDARAREEIAGARVDLERLLKTEIYALAYPNGDFSEREKEYLRETGYTCAVTLDGGYNDAQTDLFALRRMPVYDDAGVNELLVKASGMWDIIRRLFGRRPYGYRPIRSRVEQNRGKKREGVAWCERKRLPRKALLCHRW